MHRSASDRDDVLLRDLLGRPPLELATRADADIRRLHRDGAPAGTTALLADALADVQPPPGEGFA